MLELGQRGHQVGYEFPLRRCQVERQPRLRDQLHVPTRDLPQRVHQILRQSPLPGQLRDQHRMDLAGLRHPPPAFRGLLTLRPPDSRERLPEDRDDV